MGFWLKTPPIKNYEINTYIFYPAYIILTNNHYFKVLVIINLNKYMQCKYCGQELPDDKNIKIENQLDPKWKSYYLGKVKTSRWNDYGCYLFCWTYMYSVKKGRSISPIEVDKKFMDDGVYDGDLIINSKAAKCLGLKYYGREYDINKAPNWMPNVKEVDFSIKYGKQQHFVIRESINGRNVVLDPYGGVQRAINYYEVKSNDPKWKTKYFSYRKIKIS